MSIHYRVLGEPGNDNALLALIDSGQMVERILFDCGEDCVQDLPLSELQSIGHLFFSHLHMDHVAGFDSFFRATFNLAAKPHRIWGPPETIRIMQHRFQGYQWNLAGEMDARWLVSDIGREEIRTARFELHEAFAILHDEAAAPYARTVMENEHFSIEAVFLEHGIPSIGYVIREKPRRNVDTGRMKELGLEPGAWVKDVKDRSSGQSVIEIGGTEYSLEELRRQLIIETPGDSLAYLTDFRLDDRALEELAERLRGVRTIVCECQYRWMDAELARANYHMTTIQAADLAKRADADELVLFHVSQRYAPEVWSEMLEEARVIFPDTVFPLHWRLEKKNLNAR